MWVQQVSVLWHFLLEASHKSYAGATGFISLVFYSENLIIIWIIIWIFDINSIPWITSFNRSFEYSDGIVKYAFYCNSITILIKMEVSGIKEVVRSDGIERFFPLISILFSDEVLSFDYVLKCLQEWKINTTFNFAVLSSNIDYDVSVVLEEIYGKMSPELIGKLESLIPINEFARKIERVICFKCKNYGSIICGRDPSVSQIRFVCEDCRTSTLDPISDLVWSRRCGEISHSQYKQSEVFITNTRNELFQVMDRHANLKDILQSMMILQNINEVNLVKLLCLFTMKTHRGNQNGQNMIETIPLIIRNQNAMLSICTAGLDSVALFGKYLHLLYHLFII